jgi:hypothetical protein
MPTDGYTKGVLTLIAVSCLTMAYQSLVRLEFPAYPEACGSEYAPCYVVSAGTDGLKSVTGSGAVGEAEPLHVRIVD